MDNDGDLDIVSVSAFDDTVAWYENNGAANPTFTAADIVTNLDHAYGVYIHDLDGDGDQDIIAASTYDDKITWLENNGAADPTFAATTIATSADGPRDVFVADIDSDGDMDIVAASRETILFPGMKIMEQQIHHLLQLISLRMQIMHGSIAADMDGDGDIDIISASETDDKIAWYENNGAANPTFTTAIIATTADEASDIPSCRCRW